MAIRPDMFQCMIYSSKRPATLHEIHEGFVTACATNDPMIREVHARSPGSLGQSIPSIGSSTEWVIGSISLRIYLPSTGGLYSVFLFANGVIKISGGSTPFDPTQTDAFVYESWLKYSVIYMIFSHVLLSTYYGQVTDIRVCLLNGTAVLENVSTSPQTSEEYFEMCHKLVERVPIHSQTRFTSARLPAILSNSDGLVSGRICCLTLRHKDLGTVRFDHKYSVQFMGFPSVKTMYDSMVDLVALLQECFPDNRFRIKSIPPSRKHKQVTIQLDSMHRKRLRLSKGTHPPRSIE